jgi:hypothetical protein
MTTANWIAIIYCLTCYWGMILHIGNEYKNHETKDWVFLIQMGTTLILAPITGPLLFVFYILDFGAR